MIQRSPRRGTQRKDLAFNIKSKSAKKSIPGLVAQCVGHIPIAVPSNVWRSIAHTNVLIKPNPNLATIAVDEVVFTEFEFKPTLPGFYLIHHQRRESIYAPTGSGTYNVSLRILATTSNGITDEIANDTSAITGGSINDIARISLTAMVYLNGVDDSIKIEVQHDYTSTKTFGSITSENSRAHTTIMYAGDNPQHGYI